MMNMVPSEIQIVSINYISSSSSNTRFYLTLFLSLFIITILIRESSQKPIAIKHYCGRHLDNIIKEVCAGRYNGPDQEEYASSVAAGWSSTYYRDDRTRTRRGAGRRGKIVDECCHSMCGIETISQYCAENQPPPYRRDREIVDQQEIVAQQQIALPDSLLPVTLLSSSDDNVNGDPPTPTTTVPTRQQVSNKSRRNHGGTRCRCRKRNRRVHQSFDCKPCKRKCKNVNKSPLKCKRKNNFTLNTRPTRNQY